MMRITSIEITLTNENQRKLADVSIIIDNALRINNIKLIDNGKKRFVEFSDSTNSGSRFPDVVPINQKVRTYIENEIINEYEKLIQEMNQHDIL